MNCPKCRKVDMKSETHAGITIDRCPVCGGIYLDRGELERLLQKDLGNVADGFSSAAALHDMDGMPAFCPKCNREMMMLTGAGEIRFEWCDRCEAVFLDRGELASLQLFADDDLED